MSDSAERVFVVMPCYNEHTVLGDLVVNILAMGYEVVIVDDGSTPSVEQEVAHYSVHYLRHGVNLGQGAALQTGMQYALKCGANVIVHFDGDGQHVPSDILRMVDPILTRTADISLGSRFLIPEDTRQIPTKRRILLRLARIFNGIFTGLWLTDAHNGFRAMSSDAAMKIIITENRMAHATEILQLIRAHQLNWVEVPTHINYTEYSRAKGQSSWNVFNILVDLLIKRWI